MTYNLLLEQDEPHFKTQDAIAQDYRISGESDGYEGIYPRQRDAEYLSGYAVGVWQYRSREIAKMLATEYEATPF